MRMKSVDSTNGNFLVLIYYSRRCYHCRKLGKGHNDISLYYFCDIQLAYNYFKIRIFFKKRTYLPDSFLNIFF